MFHTEEANLESADVVTQIAKNLDQLLLSHFPAANYEMLRAILGHPVRSVGFFSFFV